MLTTLLNMRNRKGFTLVELIVVLVILAILAALLIPALTGYIDKANEKQIVAETRMCVMAAQTLYSEAYGEDGAAADLTFEQFQTVVDMTELAGLAEVDESGLSNITVDGNKIASLTYTNGTDTCNFTTADGYVVD